MLAIYLRVKYKHFQIEVLARNPLALFDLLTQTQVLNLKAFVFETWTGTVVGQTLTFQRLSTPLDYAFDPKGVQRQSAVWNIWSRTGF